MIDEKSCKGEKSISSSFKRPYVLPRLLNDCQKCVLSLITEEPLWAQRKRETHTEIDI